MTSEVLAERPTLTTIPVFNPATGEEVGAVPATPPGEVGAVATRARKAQRRWAETAFSERAAVLRRFHDLVLDESDRLMDSLQRETGKARRDALTEVLTVAGATRYYLSHGEEHLRERRRRPAVAGLTSARVVYKPVGLAGLITPWNFPFVLPLGDAVPALLAGNAVVIKPSELTPLSAELGRELLITAGLHPDLLQLVHGGAEVGQELINRVDVIGFTGSTDVGRKVAVAASENLIPYSLELGGKNPMIVLLDAPIDDTVTGFLAGAFANTGQTCICTERIYVERPVYDRFVEALVKRVEAMEIGWSLDFDKDMGSLISEEHTAKVWSHVEDALGKGAEALVGGRRRSDLGPCFLDPTILAGVTPDMLAYREETFGPVVSIEAVDGADEAIEKANDSVYGLNASVWGGGGDRALQVARRLETGSAGINSTLLIYNTFDAPMGGVKHSGIGRRHGEHGILRFTEEQSIVESFSTGGGYESILPRTDSAAKAKALISGFRLWRKIPFFR